MIRVLLKKQLTEIFRSYFISQKKNTARSRVGTAAMFALFVLVMIGVVGGMFFMLAKQICEPMSFVGMSWLYFAIMGLASIVFGTFGSVFNTYAGLYLGKDNDLLLSMPIPIRSILTARLAGVYLMGLMYSGVVILPTLLIYWIQVSFTAASVLCGLAWMLLISVVVLILSCVLGWFVAKASVRLKGKSYVTTLIALAFFALYYYLYFKVQVLLRDVVSNALFYGERIKGNAKIIYYFGRAAEAGGRELLIFALIVLAVLALTCYVLSVSFLRIATASAVGKKRAYQEKTAKASSAGAALFRKEVLRFTSSSSYMLNCGLGTILVAAMGVFLLINGLDLLGQLEPLFGLRRGFSGVIVSFALGMMCTTVFPAAPSVSLEGRALYHMHVLPVTSWQVLHAKLRLQLLLCAVPTLIAAVCAAIVVPGGAVLKLFTALTPVLFAVFFSMLSLLFGLLMPNFNWTNEITPIKQGGAAMLSVLGGMGSCVLFHAPYLLLQHSLEPEAYLALESAVLLAAAGALYGWLRKSGCRRFESF